MQHRAREPLSDPRVSCTLNVRPPRYTAHCESLPMCDEYNTAQN
jgi:hypothetical protein